jgi:YggT family protein
MNVILIPLFRVVDIALDLYQWAFIISAILSWLVAFGVINTHNRFVYSVMDFLYRVTEPVLRRIRSVLPATGGLDLSPLVAILIIFFVRQVLGMLLMELTFR